MMTKGQIAATIAAGKMTGHYTYCDAIRIIAVKTRKGKTYVKSLGKGDWFAPVESSKIYNA